MKYQKYNIAVAVLLFTGCLVSIPGVSASQPDRQIAPADTVAIIRLKALNARAEILQKELNEQDKKRNRVYNGVAAETLEQLNDRQDSICLDMRSKLVSMKLESAEIKKAKPGHTRSNINKP